MASKSRRKQQQVHASDAQDNNANNDSHLTHLRNFYSLKGKDEWWWIFDDSLTSIGSLLTSRAYVILDSFLPSPQSSSLREEVSALRRSGLLKQGALSGGGGGGQGFVSGGYRLASVRGDHVGWFDGREEGLAILPKVMQKIDTLVNELKPHCEHLKGIVSRSHAMVTCYPGGGARYIRHCDNAGKRNGRRLTAIVYLNEQWKDGDGGELRIFRCSRAGDSVVDCDGNSLNAFDDNERNDRTASETEERGDVSDVVRRDVAPLAGRLVLFFSDERVPHEVLACATDRYAVTVWYYDKDELVAARGTYGASVDDGAAGEQGKGLFASDGNDHSNGSEEHKQKVRQEAARMAARYGGTAELFADSARRLACEVEETDETVVATVQLPDNATASECSAEAVAESRELTIRCGNATCELTLPPTADPNDIAIKFLKKGGRRLVVTVAKLQSNTIIETSPSASASSIEPAPAPAPASIPPERSTATSTATTSSSTTQEQPSHPSRQERRKAQKAARKAAKKGKGTPDGDSLPALPPGLDCVGIGRTLKWSSATDFQRLPPPSTSIRRVLPAAMLQAETMLDYMSARLHDTEDSPEGDSELCRGVFRPASIDGLSYPLTLAWALQQTTTLKLLAALRPGLPAPQELHVVCLGCSATTEQLLLTHGVNYWRELGFALAKSQALCTDGIVTLWLTGRDARPIPPFEASGAPVPIVATGEGNVTVRVAVRAWGAAEAVANVFDHVEASSTTASVCACIFNSGMAQSASLLRLWLADLLPLLEARPPRACPIIFTCANDYEDADGEQVLLKAIGARIWLEPLKNPFGALTHTTVGRHSGDAEGVVQVTDTDTFNAEIHAGKLAKRWCRANCFVYVAAGRDRAVGSGIVGAASAWEKWRKATGLDAVDN